jgi:hypothetical protein
MASAGVHAGVSSAAIAQNAISTVSRNGIALGVAVGG